MPSEEGEGDSTSNKPSFAQLLERFTETPPPLPPVKKPSSAPAEEEEPSTSQQSGEQVAVSAITIDSAISTVSSKEEEKVPSKKSDAEVPSENPEAKASSKKTEAKVDSKPLAAAKSSAGPSKASSKKPEAKVSSNKPEAKVSSKKPEAKVDSKSSAPPTQAHSVKSDEKKVEEERPGASPYEAPTDEGINESLRRRLLASPFEAPTDEGNRAQRASKGLSASHQTTEGEDFDSLGAVRGKVIFPKQVVVPSRSKAGREAIANGKQREEQPINREPGGHRLQEDYNRPPLHFRVARSYGRRPREQAPAQYITPTNSHHQGETCQASPEPVGSRLPDSYHKKVVTSKGLSPNRAVEQPKTTRRHEPVISRPQRQPPPRKINLERWRSAQDCEGVQPQEHMYPSKRVAVDSPGDKLGDISAEEKVALIKRQLAMAEHITALRNMKHHSKELQNLLNAFDGPRLKVPKSATDQVDKTSPAATKPKSNNGDKSPTPTQDTPRPEMPAAEYKDLVTQLEQDLRVKQATHDKLVKFMTASHKAKTASTPEEQLLKTLEADMLREQLEYDSLMEKVRRNSSPDQPPRIQSRAQRQDPPSSYQPTEHYKMKPIERHREKQLRAQFFTKRLAMSLDESLPFDERGQEERALRREILPDPPSKFSITGSSTAATPEKEVSTETPEKEVPAETPEKEVPTESTKDVLAAPKTELLSAEQPGKELHVKELHVEELHVNELHVKELQMESEKDLQVPPIASVEVPSPPESAPEKLPPVETTGGASKQSEDGKQQTAEISKLDRVSLRRSAKVLFKEAPSPSSQEKAPLRPKSRRQSIVKDGDLSGEQDQGKLVALVIDRGWERVTVPHKRESDRWKQILSGFK